MLTDSSLLSPNLVMATYSVPTVCVRNLHSSAWSEDVFLKSLETQKSMNPELNRPRNRENIMKYFGVDLEAKCSSSSQAKSTTNSKIKSSGNGKNLKKSPAPQLPPAPPPAAAAATKVKQIAEMFNAKFGHKTSSNLIENEKVKQTRNSPVGKKQKFTFDENKMRSSGGSVREKVLLFNRMERRNQTDPNHSSHLSIKSDDDDSTYEAGTVKFLTKKFESRCQALTTETQKSVAIKRINSAPTDADLKIPMKKSNRFSISSSSITSPIEKQTNLMKTQVTISDNISSPSSSSSSSSSTSVRVNRRTREERRKRRFFDEQIIPMNLKNKGVQVSVTTIDRNTQTCEEPIKSNDIREEAQHPVHPVSSSSKLQSINAPTTVVSHNFPKELNFIVLPDMERKRKIRRSAKKPRANCSSSDSENDNLKSMKFEQRTAANEITKDATINRKQFETQIKNQENNVEDQGFETGSNGVYSPDSVTSMLTDGGRAQSASLSNKIQTTTTQPPASVELSNNKDPSAYSTPCKSEQTIYYHTTTSEVNQSEFYHSILSPVQLLPESQSSSVVCQSSSQRRNSSMILEQNETFDDDRTTNSKEDKSSLFWISTGRFRVSTSIFYIAPDRLYLLYDIFSQNSGDGTMMYFGIDSCLYTETGIATKTDIRALLKQRRGTSHYWFATGDFAVPFCGKYLSREKITRMFDFIRESEPNEARLTFGVDDVEFSKLPESICPKFSIESNYSLLLGLSGKSSNDNETDWPRSNRNADADAESQFNLNAEELLAERLSCSTLDNHSMSWNSDDGNQTPHVKYPSPQSDFGTDFGANFSAESLENIFATKLNGKVIPKEYLKLNFQDESNL